MTGNQLRAEAQVTVTRNGETVDEEDEEEVSEDEDEEYDDNVNADVSIPI